MSKTKKRVALTAEQKERKRNDNIAYFKRYWTLYLMLLLPFLYFIVFKYWPMVNILIAFKDYNITQSVFEMEWADNNGMKYFIQAFSNKDFLNALRNTLTLNLLDILIGFPAPIILALLLNELRLDKFGKFKKFTQTVVYMPHFLSWVIISGLALQLFAPTTGLVNIYIGKMGMEPIPFLNSSPHWIATYIFLGVWQSVGWNTIIYLAALTSISPELYEAASVDGAGRFKKMWHITLPGIRSTIVVLLIMRLGYIMGSDFDRPYTLSNKLVTDVSNVISIFVYNNGIKGMQFSLTAAVGLFQSVIGVIFLLLADKFAKKMGERGIW